MFGIPDCLVSPDVSVPRRVWCSKPFALPRDRFHLFRQHDELLRVPGNIRGWKKGAKESGTHEG